MATQVVMPKLSPTMEEGQLSRWLKQEGDRVTVGEPLAEVDTDKATMEMQALSEGVLRRILIQEGESAPLGTIVAIIGEPDEDISELEAKATSGAETKARQEQVKETVTAGTSDGMQREIAGVAVEGQRTQETIKGAPLKGDAGGTPSGQQEQAAPQQKAQPAAEKESAASRAEAGNGQRAAGGRLIVSPIAARMAAEAGINLSTLTGSGPGGRIIKRDIEEAISSGQQQAAPAAAEAAPPQERAAQAPAIAQQPLQQPEIEGAAPFRDVPMSEMRRVIARRLVTSIGPVPHFFLTTEIEMDKAADLRRSLNEMNGELKISVNDIIIKVVAVALLRHPQVNASFQEKAIRYYERADVGVAVAIEDGLITPVVRAADRKGIGEISREVRELAERARARRLRPEEYTGATFTVSNLGMFGIDDFTAVINPPEAAILAVGAAQEKPVVRNGEIAIRQIMRVTMSCDHRVIDGATGAKFLQTFKQLLENPLQLLL